MAVTYDEARDSENLRLLDGAITAYIRQCGQPANQGSACARQTVFFFPGGMASQLTRATRKFDAGAANPQQFNYEPVWVNWETAVGGARDLKMHRDSAGTFRDKSDYIIIADAPLSLAGCTPHDGLIAWCAANNADLFVFPWDWRRRLNETVAFFLNVFLPSFRQRVRAAGCPDPLASFALIGHSFGGMVVNLLLRSSLDLTNLTAAITVATPFYGYASQLHRWFEGEPYLNCLGLLTQEMMETIASLPGLYTLMFLDGATFDTGVSQGFVGAQNQSVLFPPAYPSMDAMSLNQRADPYNPQTNGSLVRYPTLTGFDRAELDYARVQFQLLASPLPPAAADKFYNIRGTRTENDDQTPISDTAGNVTWDWIQPTFDARDPSPIHDDAAVPGDDTQPEWTTHLASNDPARCITVLGHDIEHIFMMSHAGVLQEIQAILCRPVPQGGAVDPGDTPLPEPASDTDVEEFIRWCLENREFIRTLPPFSDPRVRRAKIPKRFGKLLPGIARRFIADVMKRPGPPGLGGPPRKPRGGKPRGPDGKSPKAPARRPPTRKRSGSAGARRTGKKKQR